MSNLNFIENVFKNKSNKHGFNVFFVRNDLLNNLLPRPTIEEINDNVYTKSRIKNVWPLLKNHPWVEV